MKKLLVLLSCIWFSGYCFSQVSPQSGSAVFALPIFDWKDNKSRLNSSLALNYSSGNGLKVNEIASNIGQGWRMVGAGVITRMQVGQPDDQPAYNPTGNNQMKRYPPGYLYNTQDVSKGCPGALTKYPIFGHRNLVYTQPNNVVADREIDYFTYEFNGNSGMFVLPKDIFNEGLTSGTFINDSKMKVWFERNENNPQLGIRTTIVAFYIQDQEGLSINLPTMKLLKY